MKRELGAYRDDWVKREQALSDLVGKGYALVTVMLNENVGNCIFTALGVPTKSNNHFHHPFAIPNP
jgi:hypothetical protein